MPGFTPRIIIISVPCLPAAITKGDTDGWGMSNEFEARDYETLRSC